MIYSRPAAVCLGPGRETGMLDAYPAAARHAQNYALLCMQKAIYAF